MENACSNSAYRESPRIRRAVISIKFLALTISFFLIERTCFSQIDSTQHIDSAEVKYDSATNQLFHRFKEFGDSEQRKKLRAFTEDTISTRQDETIDWTKK